MSSCPPNIIWVTIDSLRQDHTSMGGYHRETTPGLQSIADSEGGDDFNQCIAHSNWTRSSTASMITAQNLLSHGVAGNKVIPEDIPTIPELLTEQGYQTGCISRNANGSMGFDRGFDKFEWISSSTILDAVPIQTLLRYAFNIRRHSAGFTPNTAKHATPFLINDMAKRWIDRFQRKENPYFLYLHYNEPHRPYYPPLSYIDRFTDGLDMTTQEAADFSMKVHKNLYEYIANGCQFTDDEWRALIAMYDAEIAYTDECVKSLFDYVQERDDETIFVVTADHGELFGEKGLLSHKILLDDALVHVPLVVHGIDDISHQTNELVQHSDLMRTFIEISGGDGSDLDGIDLRDEIRDVAISQVSDNDQSVEKLKKINNDFDASAYHQPFVTSARTHEYKYLRSESRTTLYQLPDETNDVSDEHPVIVAKLDSHLDQWIENRDERYGNSPEGQFSEAMEQQLEDLGYMT